jgi:PAS domain S-box-containing protein
MTFVLRRLRLAEGCVAMTAALALFAVVTWTLGAWRSAIFGENFVPMAPVTAWLFLLAAAAQGARLRAPQARGTGILGSLFLLLTTVVCGLALASVWRPMDLPWDDWWRADPDTTDGLPIGRMSPLTAIAFLFGVVGFAGPRVHRGELEGGLLSTMGSTAGLMMGLVSAILYAAGHPMLYGGESVPMAVLTALGFIAFNLSLLFSGPSVGPSSVSAVLAPPEPGRQPLQLLRRNVVVFSGVAAGIVTALGLVYLRTEETLARVAIRAALEAVADLKAGEIDRWREERLSEGRFLRQVPFASEDIARLAERPNDPAARARVVSWLEPIKGGDRYATVAVFDAGGRVLLALPEGSVPLLDQPAQAAGAISAGEVALSELLVADSGESYLNLLVPIAGTQPGGSPIAAIIFKLEPRHFLFPTIQRWPGPSTTGESLLVRREGDQVGFLSPSWLQDRPAASLRHSIRERQLPAARVVMGERTVHEGIDYRGVPVLATGRPIPNSDWFIVAKMDLAEIYAPLRREALQKGLGLIVLLGGIWAGATLIWRQRQAAELIRTVEAERERQSLSDRLALITQYANDIILLTDAAGRILEANDRAVATYGYTRDEMMTLRIGGLLPTSERMSVPMRLMAFKAPGGAIYESIHQRRDGSTFPVEISGRYLETKDGARLLAVIRDITQRRAHERQIERLTRLYAAMTHLSQTMVRCATREELRTEICRVLVRSDLFRMVWIGVRNPSTERIECVAEAGDVTGFLKAIAVYADDRPEGRGPTGTALREGRTEVLNDFNSAPRTALWREPADRAGIRSSIALPVRTAGGVESVLTAYSDEKDYFGPEEISLLEEAVREIAYAMENIEKERQRRDSDLQLQISEARLRAIFEHSLDGLTLSDPDGPLLAANPAACRMFGQTENEILALGRSGIVDPTDPRVDELMSQRQRTGQAKGEMRFRRADGSTFEAEVSSTLFKTTEGPRASVAIRDITERQRAAAQLKSQVDELRRWHALMLDRESRVIELKREVNEALRRAGLAPRYPSAAEPADPLPATPPAPRGGGTA